MEELVRQFRQEAAQREGLRYPPSLRQMALEYAEFACARGGSRREIAASLGLPEATLSRWQQENAKPQTPALHEVVVVERAGEGGPVVTMPSGVRVEGLSLAELVTVLEALG